MRHCTGTVCWGRSFPRSLVRSLLPWTMLAETAAQDPSCLPVSSILCHLVGADLRDLDLPICADCKEAAFSRVHWLFGGCTDHSQREYRAGAVGVDPGGWTVIISHTRSPPLLQACWSLPGESFLQKPLDRRTLVQPFWRCAWYLLRQTFHFPVNRCLAMAVPYGILVSLISQHNLSSSPTSR